VIKALEEAGIPVDIIGGTSSVRSLVHCMLEMQPWFPCIAG
jgi:hypothetical protein